MESKQGKSFVSLDKMSSLEKGHPEKKEGVEMNLKWYNAGEHRRIIMNVIIISLAFETLFTAYLGMANLQSSINPEGGLGVYALSLTHMTIVISAILLPTFVIQHLTAKYTIVLAILGYMPFLGAQFYPTYWTLIPASIVLGICAAPLWASKCTYITHVGHLYADMMGLSPEGVVVRFFGIFFFSFQSSLIWGNLISSIVLSAGSGGGPESNGTVMSETEVHGIDASVCGRAFCPSYASQDEVISKPPASNIYILTAIYLALNIFAAALVALFVDPLSRFQENTGAVAVAVKSTKATIEATIRQLGNVSQVLIIPLTLYSGLNLGFYFADFTQAFIACTVGVGSIGYVGMAFGVCDAIGSIGFGIVVRYLGRLPVFTFGAILNLTITIILLNSTMQSNDIMFLLIISGGWGISDSIWQTQINGLYGLLFKDNSEAAFSNYRLWESLGFIIGFLTSNLLCVELKLYILIGVLSVGMCGYYSVEYLERKKIRDKTNL